MPINHPGPAFMHSSGALRILMGRYGISQDSEEASGMLRYLALLAKWNRRINLTASTAWPSIGPLFEEAIWAAGMYPKARVSHLDIGSGSGFPAVPMRILLPQMKLRLVERRERRAAFLESVVTEANLEGTEVICRRIEDYLETSPFLHIDIISWKGLRLGTGVLDLLARHSQPQTLFWLFHGAELPFVEPEEALLRLQLERRLRFPGPRTWVLSILKLRPRIVSRETNRP